MASLVKTLVTNSPIYHPLRAWQTSRRHQSEFKAWQSRGKSGTAPHLIKQKTIRELAQRFGTRVFVETGTHMGDMVAAMKSDFDAIYTIELSDALYQQACRRFRGDPKVVLIHGDSGTEMKNVIARLDQPALFWLDGHFSGGITARANQDTPVIEELFHIFEAQKRDNVIVIDDARLFGVDPAYPTVQEVETCVRRFRTDVEISVADDSIRIVPIAHHAG